MYEIIIHRDDRERRTRRVAYCLPNYIPNRYADLDSKRSKKVPFLSFWSFKTLFWVESLNEVPIGTYALRGFSLDIYFDVWSIFQWFHGVSCVMPEIMGIEHQAAELPTHISSPIRIHLLVPLSSIYYLHRTWIRYRLARLLFKLTTLDFTGPH